MKENVGKGRETSVRLRYGLPFIPASAMAGQCYCELKVDNCYVKGEIKTEAKTEGDLLHREILEMEKTTPSQLIEDIEKEPISVASFPLASMVGDIPLVGIPDAVIFSEAKPAFVVELKTTAGDPSILYEDQEFQAGIYGLILENMGFDCSGLTLAIVRWRRTDPVTETEKREFLSLTTLALPTNDIKLIEKKFKGTARVHLVPFQREKVMSLVEWAKDYWLMNREPLPTRNPWKCKACEFNASCPASLWNPNYNGIP